MNPDIVYLPRRQHVHLQIETDAGATFTAIKGAPGGDDYQSTSGSTRRIPTSSAGRRPGRDASIGNGGKTGVPGSTSPPRSSIRIDHRQSISLLGSMAASGKVGPSASPASGDYRRNHRFATGTPVGIEEYGYVAPDPHRPQHDLRRQGDALQSDHRGRAEHRAGPGTRRRQARYVRTDAADFFNRRSARSSISVREAVLKTISNGGHPVGIRSARISLVKPTKRPNLWAFSLELDAEHGKRHGVVYTDRAVA